MALRKVNQLLLIGEKTTTRNGMLFLVTENKALYKRCRWCQRWHDTKPTPTMVLLVDLIGSLNQYQYLDYFWFAEWFFAILWSHWETEAKPRPKQWRFGSHLKTIIWLFFSGSRHVMRKQQVRMHQRWRIHVCKVYHRVSSKIFLTMYWEWPPFFVADILNFCGES